ncbi:hypothetical protein [Oceanithermus sp.]
MTKNEPLNDAALDLKPGERIYDPQAHRAYLVYGVRVYDDYDHGMLDTYLDLIAEDGTRVVLQALAVSRWEKL